MAAPKWSQTERAHIKLGKLPPRSVVLDKHGDAWQSCAYPFDLGMWYRAFGDEKPLSSHELAYLHPITVIHKPKENPCTSIGNP